METRYTKECVAEMCEKLQYRLLSNVTNNLPHHLHLSQNLLKNLNADSIDEVYKPFNFTISKTKPISSVCSDMKLDSCLKLVFDKNEWSALVTHMRTEYTKYPKHKKLATLQRKKFKALIPIYLLDFAKLLRKDPDPYFDFGFNWYFTGNGNLCSLIIGDIPYIIQSVDETLYIKKYYCNYDNTIECKYSCINKCLIHETICFSLSNNTTIIGLRQKYRIYLIDLIKDGDEMKLELVKTVKSIIPLTSFSFDELSNSVYFCCADGSIHNFNMELNSTEKLSIRNCKEKSVDLLSLIRVYNKNNLLYTTSESINILDKRSCDPVEELSSYPKMKCEKISTSAFSSINQDNIYVGTAHHILKYDLRYINNKNDLQNEWTHGLSDPPIYLANAKIKNEELIYSCCQSFQKFCLITNDCNSVVDEEMKNPYLTFPYTPPSVNEALKIFQLKGHFLDPTLEMRERLNMSRSGCIFMHHNKALHFLQLNCLGDVFSQTICDKEVEFEDDVYNSFKLWSNQLNGQIKNFSASSKADMTVYQNQMIRKKKPKFPKYQVSKDLLKYKSFWKDCIKELQKCSDSSAQELVSLWELDQIEVKMENALVDANSKVSNWLRDDKPDYS